MALFLWYLILSGFLIVKACWSSTLTLECTLSCSVAQSCPALCDRIDHSPPGSSVNGILQARILEWISTPFSRGSSGPKDWTQVSVAGRFFTLWVTREAHVNCQKTFCENSKAGSVICDIWKKREEPSRLISWLSKSTSWSLCILKLFEDFFLSGLIPSKSMRILCCFNYQWFLLISKKKKKQLV